MMKHTDGAMEAERRNHLHVLYLRRSASVAPCLCVSFRKLDERYVISKRVAPQHRS